jgi:TonB family protein
MTKTEHLPDRAEARPHGNRAHMRRKLSPMAYVELGSDNGGILLNLGEGGFAVQSALPFTSRDFPELRFQVPAVQGWLTAGGRIVWMSDSKKEAGIQFTELPGEARREIQRWVSAESEIERPVERVSPRAREDSAKISESAYRAGGVAHEPAAHNTRTNGTQVDRERKPAIPRRETVEVAVTEPPPQDFHFTEYSMFAPDPEKAGVWAEPPPRRGHWGRVVLGVLVAVLFFALGATVGRETVQRWIADFGGWAQNQVAPAPKVNAPPVPTEAADAQEKSETKSTADESAKAADDVNSSSAATGDSEVERGPNQTPSETEKRNDGAESAVDSNKTMSTVPRSAISSRLPRHSVPRQDFTDSTAPSVPREPEAAPSRMAAERSILVNAPPPGSPAFFVNLPGEAVSASPAIAISARRMLEILPRSVAGARSERVVIGKLISHSEPFYPVEARNRRIEGNVELRARVGRTGEIIGVTPVSGPRLLSSAAMTAVREWRYEPTYIDGDPAETLADITIVFRLP